jgi:hypothetical protein
MALALGIAQAGARSQRAWVDAAAGAVVLLASLLNFLNHNKYPLFSAEVGLVVLALLAASGVVFALYRSVGREGRLLFQVLLLLFAIDVNFGLDMALALAGALLAVVALKRHFMAALGIVFAVVLVGEIGKAATTRAEAASGTAAAAAPAGDAPILVHLIVDEHVGIDGLPPDVPGAPALRDELISFYGKHGFRLFAGAYSEYLHTTNSIPQILNFGVEQSWVAHSKQRGVATEQNAYFTRLRELGYDLHVYQTDFVDYCDPALVRSCVSVGAKDMSPVAQVDMPTFEKAKLILYNFWDLSAAGEFAIRGYNKALAPWLRTHGLPLPAVETDLSRRPSITGALVAFDRLTAELAHAVPGQAYFAHVLLPHYPYATRRDCTLKPVGEWLERRSPGASWQVRQAGYFDQVGCLLTKLDALLGTLASSPHGRNAVVVVHGDHGARITRFDPVIENDGAFDDHDLVGSYSTLFAVRAPAIAPGYDAGRVPVARLVAKLAQSGLTSVDVDLGTEFTPSVVLENSDWKPMTRRELPSAWARP